MASLARAIAVLGAVSVIGTATQVAKGKLGAVLLGASGVGVLNQLTLLYSLLFFVAGLGFFSGVMRQIALAMKEGDLDRAKAQMNSVSFFLGFVSLVITACCLAFAKQISNLLFIDGGEHAGLVALIILAVPIAVQQRIFRAYLNATQNLRGISRAQTFADLSSVAIFALAAWQFGIAGAAFAFVGMHALLLLGMLFFAVRSGGTGLAVLNPQHFRWSEIKPNFGEGVVGVLHMGATSFAAILIGRMIIANYDLNAAGVFAVGWKIATVYLGALYAAAGNYYLPALMKLDDGRTMEAEINHAVALYMTILPPMMAGLIVFGDVIIPLLFSKEFLPAAMLMAVLLFGDVFRVTGETMGLALYARRRLVAYTAISITNSFGLVGIAWMLLPDHGLIGIGFAYVIVQVAMLAVVLVTCRWALGFRLTGVSLRPFGLAIAAIAPLSLAQLAGLSLMIKLTLALSIGAIWLIGNWKSKEFANIRATVVRRFAGSSQK